MRKFDSESAMLGLYGRIDALELIIRDIVAEFLMDDRPVFEEKVASADATAASFENTSEPARDQAKRRQYMTVMSMALVEAKAAMLAERDRLVRERDALRDD